MRKQIRKLRHWKQRFDKNAEFVFRRHLTWAGEEYKPGDLVPQALQDSPTKLRRFWESRTVELAEFEIPDVASGQVKDPLDDLPDGVTVEQGNGNWFIVSTPDEDDEIKVNGKKALKELLSQLHADAAVLDAKIDELAELAGDGAEEVLLGSDVLDATYEIEGETVTLGEIVAMAHEGSGMTVDEWNGLDSRMREMYLEQSLHWMQYQGEEEDDDWLNGDDIA